MIPRSNQAKINQACDLLNACTNPFNDLILKQKLQDLLSSESLHGAKNTRHWHSDAPYLAIEAFKQEDWLNYFMNKGSYQIFLSSGTTSLNRSASPFTEAGLKLYRTGVLRVFRYILETQDCSQLGYSLIPKVECLPESSLAKMLGWFAEELPVTYLSLQPQESGYLEALNNFFANIDSSKPCWIFATPAHLLSFIEDGKPAKLHQKTLVFITGGFKGILSKLSPEALEIELAKKLSLPQSRICAEYGMCELATPAWRLPRKKNFQFPTWMNIQTERELFCFDRHKNGSLVVDDPLRIDLGKPIRTQDIISPIDAQSFKLLGRAPKAPLKGCTLNFLNETAKAKGPKQSLSFVRPSIGAKTVYEIAKDLLNSEETAKNLASEFGSTEMGQRMQADLMAGFPKAFSSFNVALHKSKAKAARCFLVTPSTHSLAALVPLIFACAAGAEIGVRLPSKFCHSPMMALVKALNTQGASIKVLDESLRITSRDNLPDTDILIGFGSNETEAHFKKLGFPEVHFFSNYVCLNLLTETALDSNRIEAIADDLTALNRLGCQTSRGLIWGKENSLSDQVLSALHQALESKIGDLSISTGALCSESHELLDYHQNGFKILAGKKIKMVVAPSCLDIGQALQKLPKSQWIVPCFPINFTSELSYNYSQLCFSSIEGVHTLEGSQVSREGHCNRTSWNGTHQGKPWFQ